MIVKPEPAVQNCYSICRALVRWEKGMKFEIKKTREKVECGYRTLYIKRSLLEQIEELAVRFDTSFNNVVVSMIEACLSDARES